MKFERYPTYTCTDTQWLTSVPEHWKVLALKRRFQVINGGTPSSSEDSYWDGDVPWFTPEDLGRNESKYIKTSRRKISKYGLANCGASVVRSGAVIISTRAPIGHLAISEIDACCNQGCRMLVAQGSMLAGFAFYVLLAARDVLQNMGKGTTFLELSGGALGSLQIPLPPLEEQHSITEFLDVQTSKIDELIAKKRLLIDKLKEKRSALVTRTVVQGLPPKVAEKHGFSQFATMKNSGIMWIGDIPSGWRVERLRRVCHRVTDGAHISPDLSSDDYPFVSTVDISQGKIDMQSCLRTSAECYDYLVRTGCRPFKGDVLFSKDGTVGRTAVVRVDEEFVVASSLVIITPRANCLESRYLNYWLNNSILQQEVELQMAGAALRRVSVEKIGRLPIVLPPIQLQVAIADFLDAETITIDSLIRMVELEMGLLREYRYAFVTSAVTGKIDVR